MPVKYLKCLSSGRQCERYMFRIADREVPKNINFVVGSDW